MAAVPPRRDTGRVGRLASHGAPPPPPSARRPPRPAAAHRRLRRRGRRRPSVRRHPDRRRGRHRSPDTTDGGDSQGTDTLDWEDCGLGECAELDVPVDYDQPDGPTLTLSIGRVPASGDRIGALFVNPGGPGGTASDFAFQLASALPDDISEHFDIVGVDPRGLGSSAIDCGDDPDPAELYGVDYSLDSPEDTTALLDVSQDYVDACQAAAGDLLPYLGTENVARDIDAVREAMGDEQLSYLGYSYGTAIGQMLAQLFPDRSGPW